jgi:hypothetical protein
MVYLARTKPAEMSPAEAARQKVGDACMKNRIFAALLLGAATASAAKATAPQMPFAKGSIEAILPVIRAVHACGFGALRIETDQAGLVTIFASEEPSDHRAYACAETWVRGNATRLGLRPRALGDTYGR